MIDNYDFDIDYLKYLKRIKSCKEYNKILLNLNNILISNEYSTLLNEYIGYVNIICDFFDKLNINNPLEIILFYNDLLFDGNFSEDRQFEIIDTTKYDLLVKTWGSRVCTGESVCRHNASLLINILRNFGYNCEYVDMINVNKNNIFKQKLVENEKNLTINHLVLGLNYNDSIYLYDPNNYYFLFKKNDEIKDVISFVGIDKYLKYYDSTIINFCKKINDNKIDYNNVLPYYKIDGNYFNDLSNKITEIYSSNECLINNFYMTNSKKIRKISYLNKEITIRQKQY